ncbi:MAG: HAD family hydrolase [Chloroflexota bacterium]|nr:HAD family hydrolase [Chloroflexota bacterium]
MSRSNQLCGVLLDVDGTLIDSNDAHAHAWVKALQKGGYTVPFEKIRKLIGMGSDNLLPETAGVTKDSPQGKKMSDDWKDIFEKEYLAGLKSFPGTRELLKSLKERGVKMVVASSAEAELLDKLLKVAGTDGLLEDVTSSSDAKNSKPDPDIVQAALKRLGCPASNTIMLGDTPYDIEAAGKAGVRVIALRCGGWSDEELEGAVAIFQDPADLLAHLEQSPLRKHP